MKRIWDNAYSKPTRSAICAYSTFFSKVQSVRWGIFEITRPLSVCQFSLFWVDAWKIQTRSRWEPSSCCYDRQFCLRISRGGGRRAKGVLPGVFIREFETLSLRIKLISIVQLSIVMVSVDCHVHLSYQFQIGNFQAEGREQKTVEKARFCAEDEVSQLERVIERSLDSSIDTAPRNCVMRSVRRCLRDWRSHEIDRLAYS